jgi:tetratricopeptide (TPR) repeat protein
VNGWGGGGWEALYFSVRSFPYSTRSTHNFYLQVLIEGGIIGIVMLLVLLYNLFRGAARLSLREDTPQTATLFGILLLGFLHGFVDFDFDLGAYQLAVWFFAGCLSQALLPREETRSHRLPFPKVGPLLLGATSVFFLILAILYVTSAWHRVYEYYNEYAFTQEQDLEGAIRTLESAAHSEPWNPEIHFFLSQALRLKFSRDRDEVLHQRAIEAAEEALRLAPWNSAITGHLGVLYAERGDFEKALRLLKRAVELDPFRVQHYLNLVKICRFAARASLARGDREGALVFLNEGIATGTLLERTERRSFLPPDWNTAEVLRTIAELRELKTRVENGD